ncbi:MAG: ATP-binding protein [Acidilobaceae archaeon]|nr:ATP-binding protein [Acidilobaceae archaeon]MDW7973729.1 ATP-binding protein [Sulfolobales archaeon]
MERREEVENVGRMLEEAMKRAAQHGKLVGRVSRYSAVIVGKGEEVEILVEPEVYFSSPAVQRVGEYLAVVDPKTKRLVLLRITAIERADQLALLNISIPPSSFDSSLQPAGLLTTTKIRAQMVAEVGMEGNEEPVPATLSIEPQSPVIDPSPEVIRKALALSSEPGPIMGSLATPSGLLKEGKIEVRLPYRALLQHVLLVGTTGSGKTTFLKNMVVSAMSEKSPATPLFVIVDMNQDFIQLVVESARPQDPVAQAVYQKASPPKNVVVLSPVPASLLLSELEKDKGEMALFSRIASVYYEDSLKPLLKAPLAGKPICFKREGESIMCEMKAKASAVYFVPFFISTAALTDDKVASLMPGLTEWGRELLEKLRREFRRSLRTSYGPPLQALLAALRAYEVGEERLEGIAADLVSRRLIAKTERVRTAVSDIVLPIGLPFFEIVEKCYNALEEAEPHKETLRALSRRLTALLDSEFVDVMMAREDSVKGGTISLLPEPRWEDIARGAEELGAPVVLDLRWPVVKGMEGAEEPRLAAYRALQSLLEWKHSQWASRQAERGARGVVVIIDEAHQFFPQERGAREEQEASRQVASMISKVARLGRARGIGLIFSTHSPKDLHDIILQLANTKVVLRAEPHHLERMNVPPEVVQSAPYLPDRTAAVVSHVFRGGYVYVKTSPPLAAHFDLSYQMFRSS